jgi:molybdopterin synthase catalytic subunit
MWITENPINLSKLLEETQDKGTGACVIFLGTVRNNSDNKVVGITYEAHVELAAQVLQRIEKEVENKFHNSKCRVVHRIGYLGLGEISVAIVIRAPHRNTAYEASRFVIEKVKKTVPIWKKEHLKSGEEIWVEGHKLEDL